jgi:DNA-binding transcriptional LysR family regulator
LRIDQSTLCKRIQELESQLGFLLFDRSHQMVKLTEPGRKLVEGAREGVSSIERAVSAAKAANRGTDEILQIGKSPNTDPYSVSTILSIRVALFPGLKVRLWSNYSHELARDLMAGTLDLALTTGFSENAKPSGLKLQEESFNIAMACEDQLACQHQVRLKELESRNLVMFLRHVSQNLYDAR